MSTYLQFSLVWTLQLLIISACTSLILQPKHNYYLTVLLSMSIQGFCVFPFKEHLPREVSLLIGIITSVFCIFVLHRDGVGKKIAAFLIQAVTNFAMEILVLGIFYILNITLPSEQLVVTLITPLRVYLMLIGAIVLLILYVFIVLLFRRLKKWERSDSYPAFLLFPLSQAVLLFGFIFKSDFYTHSGIFMLALTGTLASLICDILLFRAFIENMKKRNLDEQLAFMNDRAALEHDYFESTRRQAEEIARLEAIFRRNLSEIGTAVPALLAHPEAGPLLKELWVKTEAKSAVGSGYPSLDATVQSRLLHAQEQGLDLTAEILLPPVLPVQEHELCVVAASLLDELLAEASVNAGTQFQTPVAIKIWIENDRLIARATGGWPGKKYWMDKAAFTLTNSIVHQYAGVLRRDAQRGGYVAELSFGVKPKSFLPKKGCV